MVGIYKITSPSGKVYIGQAVNVLERMNDYDCLDCKSQKRIYNSLKFYGANNHKFEIIELCGEQDLNYFERKWQDYYNVIGENGLNCKLQHANGKSGRLSEETKRKISISNTGKVHSEERKDKLKNRIITDSFREKCRINNTGRKASDETKKKMSLAGKNKTVSYETRLKISRARIGIKLSDEYCRNIGLAKKGLKLSEEHKLKVKLNSSRSRKVINKITDEIYLSITNAAIAAKMSPNGLKYRIIHNKCDYEFYKKIRNEE